jgi:hypothetical protein
MIKFLKVLVLVVVAVVVSGCGTLHLNHIVTGTECPTREDCIKDLGLDKQPANPDIVFVVEPLLMDEKTKAPIGTPSFNSPFLYGNVELCIAKALRNEFKNSEIVLDNKSVVKPHVKIKPVKIVSQGVIPAKLYMRIDYEADINGVKTIRYAKTDTEVFWSSYTASRKNYPLVCAILASQVREILEKEGMIKTTKTKAGD